MKKVILTFVLSSFLCVSSFAGTILNNITIDWESTVAGFGGSPSCATYNFATDHFLICDYTPKVVRIANNTDGSLTGATLDTTGLSLTNRSLGVFAICATSDGVIYGGSNEETGVTAEPLFPLFRWASEADTAPTEHYPAPLAFDWNNDSTVEDIYMEFPRAMDATGTGVDTKIAVTGSNNYRATILSTSDGSTFAVTDVTANDPLSLYYKQGVVFGESADVVYGAKADGGGELTVSRKVGGVWTADASFTPPASYAELGGIAAVGFVTGYNSVLGLGYLNDPDILYAFDGQFGTVLTQVSLTGNVGFAGYGAIDVDGDNGVGYFAVRSNTASSEIMGKISFEVYAPPLSVNSSWGLYE